MFSKNKVADSFCFEIESAAPCLPFVVYACQCIFILCLDAGNLSNGSEKKFDFVL